MSQENGTGSAVARLAQYFPQAIRVAVPIQVHAFGMPAPAVPLQRMELILAAEMGVAQENTEATVIEFGTRREVLFASNLPLEFEDRIRLRNQDGSLDEEATIIAVQLTEGRTVVAARFRRDVSGWFIRPQ